MTKRTAEQTLRDELAKGERTWTAKMKATNRARVLLAEAEAALALAEQEQSSAEKALRRIEAALEALLPPSEVDALLEAGREATTIRIVSAPVEEPALSSVEQDAAFWNGDAPALDREATIAAATGTDVETVRKASRSKA